MTSHLHRYPPRYTRTDEISSAGSPEIMHEKAFQSCFFARSLPGFTEFADRFAVIVEDVRTFRDPIFPCMPHHFQQTALEAELLRVFVLGMFVLEPDSSTDEYL